MRDRSVILGIETSCDETAAALLVDGEIVADRTTRQVLHEYYGGVVPELASRAHERLLAPAVQSILNEAGLKPSDVTGVAVTYGPGLAGALLVGLSFAKGYSGAMGIPFWAINHIEAHLWIAQLTHGTLPLPSLALIVSGGHTLLIAVEGLGKYKFLGSTKDDAVGELFDKVGRVIGFPFPAGAQIDKLAIEYIGKPVLFPVSRVKGDPYAFSFSGIKTAVLGHITKVGARADSGTVRLDDEERKAICAGLMNSVYKSIAAPLSHALSEKRYEALIVAGGVSASKFLRQQLAKLTDEADVRLIIPPFHHCTDNGAMIAYLGHLLEINGVKSSSYAQDVNPSARLHQERVQ